MRTEYGRRKRNPLVAGMSLSYREKRFNEEKNRLIIEHPDYRGAEMDDAIRKLCDYWED